MDGQPKLTRTQSSLLRSSPTIRSSIQSLSSIVDGDGDEEDPKPHGLRHNSAAFTNPTPPPFHWLPLLAVATITLLVSFVYLKSEAKMSTSENLLLTLTLVAVALFLAGRNKQAIDRSIFSLKKLRLSKNRSDSSVDWYIDSESREKLVGLSHRSSSPGQAAREGVEFYSNGDFYEGQFHKGKCNGSGVYTYLASDRYEGDWVDGRYDGYGIESSAHESRYWGQYRHSLRHGFRRITTEQEKLRHDLELKLRQVAVRIRELNKSEALTERERQKLEDEKKKNDVTNNSLKLASQEQEKADGNVTRLVLQQQREKEQALNRVLQLEKQFDAKQKLEMKIEELKGKLEVTKYLGEADDESVKKKMEDMASELQEKVEKMEDMESLNQVLIKKELESNDELVNARKVLIEKRRQICRTVFR